MTFAVLLADALDVRFGATTLTGFEPEVLVFMNRQDTTYIRYHASRVKVCDLKPNLSQGSILSADPFSLMRPLGGRQPVPCMYAP